MLLLNAFFFKEADNMSHWQHPCCSHNDTGSINCCVIYFILNRAAIYKRKRRKDLKQRSCARCFTGSTEVFLIHIFLHSLWYTQNISLWQDTLLVEDFCQLIMLRTINHRENASIWTQRELSVNYNNLEKRGISTINDFFEWKQINRFTSLNQTALSANSFTIALLHLHSLPPSFPAGI